MTKALKKEILMQAVESALVSAVRKIMDVKLEDEIRIEFDKTSGKIRAFVGKEEIKSKDFGRIAAQTAKQVIIQKIREAEKDVIFGEFQGRVGEIVSGGVYRFDRGNIIVDLGKTEGIIPKSETINQGRFPSGRAYQGLCCGGKKRHQRPADNFVPRPSQYGEEIV
jgi:S1 RNA binding domain./NusA N-terminal domain.